ncbi:uncharacterized protein EI90DRAFT_3080514, partial [Cantharellus anzutake]|uniref:uncharacterized protein n=1 Tax=Cantharellus anzutake TaxID=1750568 RepID=UPI001908AAE2
TIEKVLTGLEGLAAAQPFPFVKLAVQLFHGVVQLETQRRSNSAKARALILQLSDMMSTLLQLHYVKDPTLKSLTGETDIKTVGNLVDQYHKHSSTSKFFFSGKYQTEFKAAGETLVTRKQDIMFALQIHNTVTTDDISVQVRQSNAMLTQLIRIMEYKSVQDKRWEQSLEDLGGRKKVLDSEELLTKIASEIEGEKVGTDGKGGDKADTSKDQTAPAKAKIDQNNVLSPRERMELRQPLETILQANFRLKSSLAWMPVHTRKFSTQKYGKSGKTWCIISIQPFSVFSSVLTLGMAASVKARDFSQSSVTPAANSVLSATTGSRHNINDNLSPIDVDLPPPHSDTPFLILQDKWCLKFLSFPYANAIMEAFDDDSSGYIRISEVNDFCDSIPEGWTLLQWIAYWARGWRQESSIYSRRINYLLTEMRVVFSGVMLENSQLVLYYYHQGGWKYAVERLTYPLPHDVSISSDSPLDELVKRRMAQKEERLSAALERMLYIVDAPESLALVCGPGRIEKDLFAVFYLIILRHCRMVGKAKEYILDDREFMEASSTLSNIGSAVKSRVSHFADGYRQRGLDVEAQFGRFYGGIYEYLNKRHLPEGYSLLEIPPDQQTDFWRMIWDEKATDFELRYGRWTVDTSAYDLANTVSLVPAQGAKNSINQTLHTRGDAEPHDQLSPTEIGGDTLADYAQNLKASSSNSATHTDTILSHVVLDEGSIITQAITAASSAFQPELVMIPIPPATDKAVKQILLGLEIIIKSNKFPFLRVGLMNAIKMVVGRHVNALRLALIALESATPLLQLQSIKNAYDANENGSNFAGRVSDIAAEHAIDVNCLEKAIEHPDTSPQTIGVEKVPSISKFDNVSARLKRRKEEFELCFAVHCERGLRRFRAAATTILKDIRRQRHSISWPVLREKRLLRLEYVRLRAQQYLFRQAEVVWKIGIPIPDEDEVRLEQLSAEIAPKDKGFWDSLAVLERRRILAHLDRQCDVCRTVPIRGPRWQCLFCNEFDLCADCEASGVSDVLGDRGSRHYKHHPLIKVVRPVVEIERHWKIGFERNYSRFKEAESEESEAKSQGRYPVFSISHVKLISSPVCFVAGEMEASVQNQTNDGDEHDGESHADEVSEHDEQPVAGEDTDAVPDGDAVHAESESEEELADGTGGTTEYFTGPANTTAPEEDDRKSEVVEKSESSPSTYEFDCSVCGKTLTGTRFLTTSDTDAQLICSECEETLMREHEKTALPDYLRVLLKFTLPEVIDEETDEATEQEVVYNKLHHTLDEHMKVVDDRLEKLEGKLEHIISFLESLRK